MIPHFDRFIDTMSQQTHPISGILFKYCCQETLTAEEQTRLDEWLNASPENRDVFSRLQNTETLQTDLQNWMQMQQETDKAWAVFETKMTNAPRRLPLRNWLPYAAAVIIMIGIGSYFLLHNKKPKPAITNTPVKTDIAPGRQGAVLTLADGTQVVLDSMGNGVVAQQNGAQVVLNNGQLAYNAAGDASTAIAYNQMTTPKGRQFQLVLPDGSKVWLNAASSIKYPTSFTGNERRVTVEGEAYFEIAANKEKPFIADVDSKASIRVLGTSFNVNAYSNESTVKTTLLEGSVKIADRILKPGQQAVLTQDAQFTIADADVAAVTAWKNGAFNFDNVPLDEVMRQLERWYDIQVVYENGIPDIRFVGKLSRNMSLSDLLSALRDVEVKFRIESNRRLIVSK